MTATTCITARLRRRVGFLLALLLVSMPIDRSFAATVQAIQPDPVAQCVEGIRLYAEGHMAEASPLLEAGFANRDRWGSRDQVTLGRCAVAVGYLWEGDHRYNDSVVAYTVALQAFRRAGDRGADEVIALSNLGATYGHLGQYKRAVAIQSQALTMARTLGDRTNEAIVLIHLGIIYGEQGQDPEALGADQQALAISRALRNRALEGAILNNMALVYKHQGQYAQAFAAFQGALAIFREQHDQVNEGTALESIGSVYAAQGAYQQAHTAFQQSLAIERAIGNQAAEGQTFAAMGVASEAQGQFQQALAAFQQGLVVARAFKDRDLEAGMVLNIGAANAEQGQYQQALIAFEQAQIIFHELGNHVQEATALGNIGTIYGDQGQYQLSLRSYQQQLSIGHTLNNRAIEGSALVNIGAIYTFEGHHQQALVTDQHALIVVRAAGDRYNEGEVLANMGAEYIAQQQYREALAAEQQALNIATELGDRAREGTRLDTIGIIYDDEGRYQLALTTYHEALIWAVAVDDRVGMGDIWNNIGIAYEGENKYSQAIAAFQHAMDLREQVRASINIDQGRIDFIAQFTSLYDHAIRDYHDLGQDDQAFQTSERGRARAFLDSLATGVVQLSDHAADELLQREQKAYAAVQSDQDRLDRAQSITPRNRALVATLKGQLESAKRAHDSALAAIQHYGGQLAGLVPSRNAGVLNRPAVQRLLNAKTTLITYWVSARQTLAFILTRHHFRAIALPVGHQELYLQIHTLENFADLSEACPMSARRLYHWLVAPLLPYVKTPRLAIVPHDVLHYLPFAALCDGRHALLNDYTLTTLPSASSLAFIEKHSKRRPAAPLIMGNPAASNPQLRPLAYADDEARAVAKIYGVSPLLGAQATARVLRARAATAGIIHVAAHALYDNTDPLASAVYLAPSGNDNGRLTVRSVYALNLHDTELVVLSACQTQLGNRSAGDEIVGLTRAFLFAGTPSVVSTLWSVDDQATKVLMEQFYKHLRKGMSKAEAMRQAQLELRKQYPSPYYWAPFVLAGDGEGIAS